MDGGSLVFGLGPGEAAAVSLAVAVGAAVQGSIGFGLAVLAAPVLALIEPRLVPGPVLLSGVVLGVLVTLREREAIHFGGVAGAIMGRALGTVAAAAFLAVLPRDVMSIVFGVLVLAAIAMSAVGYNVRPTPINVLIAGTASGFMGTISSIGGPPIALVYQAERGERIRATLSGFFLVGTAGSVTALAVVGRFGREETVATLLLLPGIVTGFLASSRLAPYVDRRGTRPLVLAFSTIAGVAVIARGALELLGDGP
jgi:hypothetical protein